MILEPVDNLTKGSHKKILVKCDICGEIMKPRYAD